MSVMDLGTAIKVAVRVDKRQVYSKKLAILMICQGNQRNDGYHARGPGPIRPGRDRLRDHGDVDMMIKRRRNINVNIIGDPGADPEVRENKTLTFIGQKYKIPVL